MIWPVMFSSESTQSTGSGLCSGRVQKREDPFRSRQDGLDGAGDLANRLEGDGDDVEEHQETNQGANVIRARIEQGSRHANDDETAHVHETHGRINEAGDPLGLAVCLGHLFIDRIKLFLAFFSRLKTLNS
jgi:hypothetical protein